jgi:hypothetical protein
MTYPVTMTIEPQRVCDMFVGAFEGGSNYWLGRGLVQLVKPDQAAVANPEGVVWWGRTALYEQPFEISIYVVDDEETKVIDNASVENALRVMAEKYPRHFADLVNENDDADTSDVFLQCCLFGELVYG